MHSSEEYNLMNFGKYTHPSNHHSDQGIESSCGPRKFSCGSSRYSSISAPSKHFSNFYHQILALFISQLPYKWGHSLYAVSGCFHSTCFQIHPKQHHVNSLARSCGNYFGTNKTFMFFIHWKDLCYIEIICSMEGWSNAPKKSAEVGKHFWRQFFDSFIIFLLLLVYWGSLIFLIV